MPLLLPSGYLNSTCNLKSSNLSFEIKFPPASLFTRIPFVIAKLLFSGRFHFVIFRSRRLTGSAHSGEYFLTRDVASFPSQFITSLLRRIVPVNFSPSSLNLKFKSSSPLSHSGDMVNENC